MIQGFETKENTDIVIRSFVKGVKGVLHKKVRKVDQYEQTEWPTFKDFTLPIAVFGVLRGTGNLIKNSMVIPQDFFYFDHAYILGNRHLNSDFVGDKVYRLTKNNYSLTYIDKLTKEDEERIEKYKEHITIKPWKKEGKYILVCEPSDHAKKYFNASDWLEHTLDQLKSYTKKEILVRKKTTPDSFKKQLEEAFACVTFQSTACIESVLNGVPSFCDGISCGVPVSNMILSEIENPNYSDKREEWINSLLANQFTMTEIGNGVAWRQVSGYNNS